MCRALTPNSRYDNSIIELIGNVCCPNTMYSDILCVLNKIFNLSAEATINVLNVPPRVVWAIFPLRSKQIRFSWNEVDGFSFLKMRKTQFKMFLEMSIVQHAQTKHVFTFQLTKFPVSTTVKSGKAALTCWIFLLRSKNWQLCCLVLMIHIGLQEKWVVTTKKGRNDFHFRWHFPANRSRTRPSWSRKKKKSFRLWHDCDGSPCLVQLTKKSVTFSFFYTFNLQ